MSDFEDWCDTWCESVEAMIETTCDSGDVCGVESA